ncbi:MAG: acyl-CoA dehydrogenase [Rhodothermales bacterium]|nr:acyl-CoA dehydrogenase [Rhodothermales bacterium]
MDFSWTDEQLALRRQIISFAEENLNDNLVDDDRAGRFSRSKWKACAEFGIQGLNVPVAYGGQGHDILTTVFALEALGYGCRENSLPFAIGSQLLSVQPALLKVGSEEQKNQYLPALCSGEFIGAFGITEPETGSDTYALQTTATPRSGGYVLNGRKSYITSAPVADVAVVFASTKPELGRWGISAFIVERGIAGFRASPVRDKMGMRTTPMGDLIFEECFVPESCRLGPEGVGVSLFATAMESERGYIFATQIGRMERQLEESVRYAEERRAFDQPINEFQSVSNRLADMKLRLETARMLLHKVAWLEQTGQPVMLTAALAKLHISECLVESSLDAIRIHGARGYVTEFEVERDLRDAVGGLIYSGTSDIQRNLIARLLSS